MKKEKLTKREQFAMAAMQAIVRKKPFKAGSAEYCLPGHDATATGAVAYADALIRALGDT